MVKISVHPESLAEDPIAHAGQRQANEELLEAAEAYSTGSTIVEPTSPPSCSTGGSTATTSACGRLCAPCGTRGRVLCVPWPSSPHLHALLGPVVI
jgi:hypothetical protein